jgi:hypothetical protein
MKKLRPVLLLLTMAIVLVTSCKKDSTDARDQFLGSYSITETFTNDGGGTGGDNYTITITNSTVNDQQILINNLGNTVTTFGVQMNVNATVSGNSLTIATQVVTLGSNTLTVTGSGSLNANSILVWN